MKLAMRSIAAMCLAIALAASIPAAISIELVQVATGFNQPLLVTNAGDGSGRLFVLQRTGLIRIVDGGGAGVHTTFHNMASLLTFGSSEQGLLGLAFHPDYDGTTERRFYTYHTAPGGTNGISTLTEWQTELGNVNAVYATSERVLFTYDQPFQNHNGGMLAFGPESPNAHLYIGLGDGGSGGDPGNRAQTLSNPLGSILRIDVDTAPDPGLEYHIPLDNPFVGTAGASEEIWAYGVRNPWRFSFDRGTGALIAGDVGQDTWEEVDVITAGANCGWRNWEGNHPYTGPQISGTLFPIHEYNHNTGNYSITGGYVYRGAASSFLQGHYFFADFVSGRVWALEEVAPGVWAEPAIELVPGPSFNISSFGEDEDGELYVCDYANGRIFLINDLTLPTGLTLFGPVGN